MRNNRGQPPRIQRWLFSRLLQRNTLPPSATFMHVGLYLHAFTRYHWQSSNTPKILLYVLEGSIGPIILSKFVMPFTACSIWGWNFRRCASLFRVWGVYPPCDWYRRLCAWTLSCRGCGLGEWMIVSMRWKWVSWNLCIPLRGGNVGRTGFHYWGDSPRDWVAADALQTQSRSQVGATDCVSVLWLLSGFGTS